MPTSNKVSSNSCEGAGRNVHVAYRYLAIKLLGCQDFGKEFRCKGYVGFIETQDVQIVKE